MKQLTAIGTILILVLFNLSCKGQANKQGTAVTADSQKVSVYYFHFTRRCETCKAVEENTKKAVEALYPDEVKSGEYTFTSLNLDDESTKAIADKLGIGGQTLLVVCGDKKADLTSIGFMNARDPEKLKDEIKQAVDKILL